jgi:hypothetical protein
VAFLAQLHAATLHMDDMDAVQGGPHQGDPTRLDSAIPAPDAPQDPAAEKTRAGCLDRGEEQVEQVAAHWERQTK